MAERHNAEQEQQDANRVAVEQRDKEMAEYREYTEKPLHSSNPHIPPVHNDYNAAPLRMTEGTLATYPTTSRQIWASSVGRRIRSYTFDASTYTADANGDKYVPRGTVLTYTAGGKAQVRTGSATAIGVLNDPINCRDGDEAISIAVAGAIRQDRCWDNNAYGAVAAGVKTDLPFIQFVSYDI